MFHALVSACGTWDQLGRKKVETYDLTLSAYLKERIAEILGVGSLYSPKDDPKLVSAVTSFNPFTNPADVMNSAKSGQFVARMLSDFNPGFVIRNVNVAVIGAPSDHYVIRISTPCGPAWPISTCWSRHCTTSAEKWSERLDLPLPPTGVAGAALVVSAALHSRPLPRLVDLYRNVSNCRHNV